MDVNILPMDLNTQEPSLRTSLTSRRRIISKTTTAIHTNNKALMVLRRMLLKVNGLKMIIKAIGKGGNNAYHTGTDLCSTVFLIFSSV